MLYAWQFDVLSSVRMLYAWRFDTLSNRDHQGADSGH